MLDRLWVVVAGDASDLHGPVVLRVEVPAAVVRVDVAPPRLSVAAGLDVAGSRQPRDVARVQRIAV